MSEKIIPVSKSPVGYYGKSYQENMVNKYENRENNHRKSRIDLAHRMVRNWVLPRFGGKLPEELVLLDVGCSIGTFAIEFAKKGFKTYGIDFSPSAIELAQELAEKEVVKAKFIHGDILDIKENLPPLDIVSCFDIFEHLHDDELGALLNSLRLRMSENGCLIFHTYPTQYDYIFFGRSIVRWPMYLLKNLPSKYFNRAVKIYASLLDMLKLLFNGGTQRELVKSEAHCNPSTVERLGEIFDRAGWEPLFLESSFLYRYNTQVEKVFSKQPIVHRDIQGVIIPVKK